MAKRFFYNLIIILIIMLCFIPTKVMAIAVNLPIYFPDLKDRQETIEYVKSISEEYQEGTDSESTAKIKVNVYKEGNGEYYIGKKDKKVKFDVKDGTELFDDGDIEVGSTWKVWLDIEYTQSSGGVDPNDVEQGITVVKSYTEDGVFDYGPTTGEAIQEGFGNVGKAVKTFAEKLEHNFFGTLMTWVLDIVKTVLGDWPQSFINMIVTSDDGTAKDRRLAYTYERLDKDGANGNRNKYTRVGTYSKGNKKDWQTSVKDIKKDDSDFESFSKDTEIPVIKADLYNITMGHIAFLDTNFLTGNENHAENSIWTKLRNIAASLMHISIYIGAAILLVTLIFTGIQIVRFSFTDPVTEAEYKERLHEFAISVISLVGTVIIMGLCIFGSNEIFSAIQKNNDTYELPVRVNVENAEYSFSTTIAGYAGYMAGMQNIDKSAEKAYYTFSYIILVWLNVIAVLIMAGVMFVLLILSIIGPIIASLGAFGIAGHMRFRTWVRLYVSWSMVRVVMALGYFVELHMKF